MYRAGSKESRQVCHERTIAGVTSSTLQISTALSVAVIGGIFYSMLDNDKSSANITHAFIVALLAMAVCLATGAGLSLRLIRRASDPASRIPQRSYCDSPE
ncbi:hypothetical protein TUM17576_20730 [Enterobacter hormaechei]|nr:hypothetical protein TUM17576_20730 [Enterobacter hormaechei]